jgi:hypothetical protein
MAKPAVYKSLETLSSLVTGGLVGWMAAQVAFVATGAYRSTFWAVTAILPGQVAPAVELTDLLLGSVVFTGPLFIGVVFLRWFHRAYSNIEALDLLTLRHGRGWAIGCWFVPFMNLVRPFRIAEEIAMGSQVVQDIRSLVMTWWVLFCIWAACVDAPDHAEFQSEAHTVLTILTGAVGLLAAAACVRYVRVVTRAQALVRTRQPPKVPDPIE